MRELVKAVGKPPRTDTGLAVPQQRAQEAEKHAGCALGSALPGSLSPARGEVQQPAPRCSRGTARGPSPGQDVLLAAGIKKKKKPFSNLKDSKVLSPNAPVSALSLV